MDLNITCKAPTLYGDPSYDSDDSTDSDINISSISTSLSSPVLTSSNSEPELKVIPPIFSFLTIITCKAPTLYGYPSYDSNAKPEKRCPTYDVNKFVFDVETEISNHGPNYDYHKHNFNNLVSFLQGKINDNFLVDENKYSNFKRNRLFNPWFTNGIIASVQRKTYFYDQWKKSCRDDNKLGDEELYMRYKNFRFELRKIIKLAKKTFYFKKFECAGGHEENLKTYK